MHPQQKESVSVLAVFCAVSAVFAVASKFFPVHVALSVFGLTGVVGLSPLIFYRKRAGRVLMDERDKQISSIAGHVAGGCLWVSIVAASMILLVRNGFSGDVCMPVIWLSYAVVAGTMMICAARSITILVLYRRGVPG